MKQSANTHEPLGGAGALLAVMTSTCVPPARFWEAASANEWLDEERAHLAACAACRGHKVSVEAALGVAVRALFLRASKPLKRLALPDAASDQGVVLPPWEEVTFDGGAELTGRFFLEGAGGHWLALAHTARPAGTLLQVELSGAGGVAWRGLVMLRPGSIGTLGRCRLPEGVCADGPALAVACVGSVAELSADLAPALEESFAAACRDDPPAVPEWLRWAARNAEGAAGAVAAALKKIAEASPGPPAAHRTSTPRWAPRPSDEAA